MFPARQPPATLAPRLCPWTQTVLQTARAIDGAIEALLAKKIGLLAARVPTTCRSSAHSPDQNGIAQRQQQQRRENDQDEGLGERREDQRAGSLIAAAVNRTVNPTRLVAAAVSIPWSRSAGSAVSRGNSAHT